MSEKLKLVMLLEGSNRSAPEKNCNNFTFVENPFLPELIINRLDVTALSSEL